jgi:type IV secretion system protein VirB9
MLLLAASAPLGAETAPLPGPDDPRLQTLVEQPGETARLVAFPEASLTLIMQQGEQIQRVVLSDGAAFHVAITGDNDSLSITPLRAQASATLQVETASGMHRFDLETGRGLAAAYVVRMVASSEAASAPVPVDTAPDLASMSGHYRIDGDRATRPARIADDGARTYIAWGSEQSLPAVLGIGPSGDEEVVAGYMRHGFFTIDRVYPELVFRIDRKKSTATRQVEVARR